MIDLLFSGSRHILLFHEIDKSYQGLKIMVLIL